MNAIAESVRSRDVPYAVGLMNDLISSDNATPADVSRQLHALSDEDMSHYGLRSYRMNIAALLGERKDIPEIDRLARAAAISKLWLGWEYHHHYLSRLTATPEPAQLERLPVELIRSLLSRGRGLILATFHLGHMRHIPSDIAHAGISVMVPLARDAYENYESARRATVDAALWRNFRHVCVEDPSGSLALARNLARGGCVLSTIDGNTGLDGPRGDDRRSIVAMLDTQVRVKNGLIAMAARFGVPILPIIATTVDGRRVCHTSPCIDPVTPLKNEDAIAFVEATAAALYATLADRLLQAADEWCGGDLFHQWRLPRAIPSLSVRDAEARLSATLVDGVRAHFDLRRITPLSALAEGIFVDVHTMKCYRLGDDDIFAGLLLDPDRGVTREWIDGLNDEGRNRTWRLLGMLASRGALSLSVA